MGDNLKEMNKEEDSTVVAYICVNANVRAVSEIDVNKTEQIKKYPENLTKTGIQIK